MHVVPNTKQKLVWIVDANTAAKGDCHVCVYLWYELALQEWQRRYCVANRLQNRQDWRPHQWSNGWELRHMIRYRRYQSRNQAGSHVAHM